MAVTSKLIWIVGRVVYGAGLENQRTERFRGFESYTIRQIRCLREFLGVIKWVDTRRTQPIFLLNNFDYIM